MQTFIKIIVAIVVLALSLTVAAFLLPSSYRVERAIQIQAPAEVVFAQVNDLRHWQTWTIWASKDPEMIYETSPASAGKDAWQRWNGPKAGRGELKITASEPPSRVSYDLYFPEYDSRSSGDLIVAPAEGGGVTVTWSNGGKLGMNPIMRWMGLTFDRAIGGDFEAGLARLKTTCEAAVKLETPPVAVAPATTEAPVTPPAIPAASTTPAEAVKAAETKTPVNATEAPTPPAPQVPAE